MTDTARHLNNVIAQRRAAAETHVQALADVYQGLLEAAGRGVASDFRSQTKTIVAATNPWQPPATDLVDGEALEKDARKKIPAAQQAVLAAVAAPAAADLGIDFDIQAPSAQSLLAQLSNRLGSLGDAIRQPVNDAIQAGYENGWSVARTSDEIVSKVGDFAPFRADMLARTDLNALSNGASLSLAQQVPGVDTKTWLAVEDERTREDHADADGQTVPIDQPFTVGGENADYPGDPNLSDAQAINCRCLGPSVRLSDARITGAMVRPHEGHLWRITTAGGRELTVTRNHPVLTRNGWRAAHLLNEGDDLICSVVSHDSVRSPDKHDVVSASEKVFAAVALTASRGQRVSKSAVNFHGDVPDRDVDVAVTNDFLALEGDASLGEEFTEVALTLAHREMSLDAYAAALNGVLKSDEVGFSSPSGLSVAVGEDQRDGAPLHAVFPVESEHAHPSIEVGDDRRDKRSTLGLLECSPRIRPRAADATGAEVFPDGDCTTDAGLLSDLLVRLTGRVELDPVVDVSAVVFSGHVYNFQAVGGVYFAEGIATANCTVIFGEPLVAAATPEGGDMDETITAAASGDTELPLSDRARVWDAGEATGRLKKWASSDGSGDPDTIDYSKLARGYFWRDKADGDPKIGDLKFPFADIISGKLTAVWRGVTDGAQRLSSAKNVDVPSIQKRMDAYYSAAKAAYNDPSITPPWAEGKNTADLDTMATEDLELLTARAGQILMLRAMINLEDFTILQAAAPGEPTRWVAPAICVEGQPTEDGRVLMPGSVSWRDGVLPLGIMLDTPHGDLSTAPLCGGIDTFQRLGDVIAAGGYFNDNLDPAEAPEMVANARQAIAAIQSRTATGISVDLMVIDGGLIYESALDPAGEDELPPELEEGAIDPIPILDTAEEVEEAMEDPQGRLLAAVFEGVIGGACICPVPAIANASIAVVAAGFFERLVITSPLFTDCGCDSQPVPLSLVAAVAPLEPPAEWFEVAELDKPTPLTVEDDGRVYGHVALWDTCHEGFPGRCVRPPRSRTGYRKFHNGELRLDDGSRVSVGKLTLAAGHASVRGVTAEQARAHYDNTSTVAAFVRAQDGRHGIWVSGALKSNLSPEHVRDLMANPLSGDWRNGEMIAAHAVIDPGFPVLRASGLGELLDPDDEGEPLSPLERLRPTTRKVQAA